MLCAYARRVERRPVDDEVKLKRLRRAMVLTVGVLYFPRIVALDREGGL